MKYWMIRIDYSQTVQVYVVVEAASSVEAIEKVKNDGSNGRYFTAYGPADIILK